MKKKECVEKAKMAILNRVRFHAPVVYDDNIDLKLLQTFGVDVSVPIFKFDKGLNCILLSAFALAQKEEKFNVLMCEEGLGKLKKKAIKKIENLVLYDLYSCPAKFIEMTNKLNINYASSSNYNVVFKDKFFKVQNQILNPSYDEFCLRQTTLVDSFFVDYQEFVLNGNNVLVKVQNKAKQQKEVTLELNVPLERGYYLFKKMQKSVLIESLQTRKRMFLNFLCKNAKFSFSNVDGLENSVFCCINVKVKLSLLPEEEQFVFFNLGEEKFSFAGLKEILHFKQLSRQKSCEIFNLQVKTKNPKFDFFFNRTLPQKIWLNWLNGEENLPLEQKYVNLKRLFIKGVQEISLVNFREIGLRELGIFNGQYYKKILVVKGEEKFLRVGRTFFYNINGITNRSLGSEEPMTVCFGEG